MKTKISAVHKTIKVGPSRHQKSIDLYCGFVRADSLNAISYAPSFSVADDYTDISLPVERGNVERWQRPSDKKRIQDIGKYFDDTISPKPNFMVNPILLSQDFDNRSPQYNILPIKNHFYEIEIEHADDEKPLIIVDGQHRLVGMAASKQKHNAIPFVLILAPTTGDFDNSIYDTETIAKIFAEVNTTSVKVDPVHDEWLKYTYALAEYTGGSTNHHYAFEIVLSLNNKVRYAKARNPFCNQINFNKQKNPKKTPKPLHSSGGFSYDCKELKDILYGTRPTRLTPDDTAEQIVLAYHALVIIKSSYPSMFSNDVFFNHNYFGGGGQQIIQEAFLRAVLWEIDNSSVRIIAGTAFTSTSDWEDYLKTRNFDTTNWDFLRWKIELSGSSIIKKSKELCTAAFQKCFKAGTLSGYSKSLNIAEYLQGDDSSGYAEFDLSSHSRSKINIMLYNVTPSKIKPFCSLKKPLPTTHRQLHLKNLTNVMWLTFKIKEINNKVVNPNQVFPYGRVDAIQKNLGRNCGKMDPKRKGHLFDHRILQIKIEISFEHYSKYGVHNTIELIW